jgi:hypothetical protein
MSVATTTAIGIGAAISAGGAIGGSAIAAHSQGKATDKAVAAETSAADKSLGFNREVYANTLANEQPYLDLGNQAAGTLGARLDSLTAPYPGGAFSFTPADFQNDPAYQWNRDQGLQGIQRLAASQGGLVSGGVIKDAGAFASGLAANTYQQQYQNALSAYQMAYQQFNDTNANAFSRLMGVSGMGQAAASNTAAAGAGAAGNAAGISGSNANALAGLYTGQGNASGAATMAGANAITGGVNQFTNYLAQQQMLKQLQGSSYATAPKQTYDPWGD